jgi:glyoxylase-like metal-dependent hydrolase (beta-lactamase superfamily II)
LEVVDGLWQIKIPMEFNPLGYTFSYLLVDAATLIDAGVGTKGAILALESELRKVGLKGSDLERVILTHLHRDHVGLVGYIKSISNAEVYAHETAPGVLKSRISRPREEVREEINLLGGSGLFNILRGFIPRSSRRYINLNIDKTVADGDTLELRGATLRTIWTPGHASEHICLYDIERRVLFSGDHILPRITPHVSLHTQNVADPLRDYLNSLEKMKGLPADIVLPAHEWIFRDLDERIKELKHHHSIRCGEIKRVLGKDEMTVFQISSRISWNSRPWPLMSLRTRSMAAAETLAHLVYLRNSGEITERLHDGTLYYNL